MCVKRMKYKNTLDFIVNGGGYPISKSLLNEIYTNDNEIFINDFEKTEIRVFDKTEIMAVEWTAEALCKAFLVPIYIEEEFAHTFGEYNLDASDDKELYEKYNSLVNNLDTLDKNVFEYIDFEIFANYDQLISFKEDYPDVEDLNLESIELEYVSVDYINGEKNGGIVFVTPNFIEKLSNDLDADLAVENLIKSRKYLTELNPNLQDFGIIMEENISQFRQSENLTYFLEPDEMKALSKESPDNFEKFKNALDDFSNTGTIEYDLENLEEIDDWAVCFYRGLFDSMNFEPEHDFDINNKNSVLGNIESFKNCTDYQRILAMNTEIEVTQQQLKTMGQEVWKTVHFVASQDNWNDGELTEYERTFMTNSIQKIFDDNMGGYSMFATALDEKCWGRRNLLQRMEDAEIDKFFFKGTDLKNIDLNHLKSMMEVKFEKKRPIKIAVPSVKF